jgi:hypothetical protein
LVDNASVQVRIDENGNTWTYDKNTGEVTRRNAAGEIIPNTSETGETSEGSTNGDQGGDGGTDDDDGNDYDDGGDDDDSDDGDDDSDDGDDEEDDSDDDDSGDEDSSSEELPPGMEERFGNNRSAAKLLAELAKIRETHVNPPSDEESGSAGPPIYEHPAAGLVLPPGPEPGASSGSGVPSDPHEGTDGPGPDPAGPDSTSTSTGGAGVAKGVLGGHDPVMSANVDAGGQGGGTIGPGGASMLWNCRRALIPDYKGGLWCYCPVAADPVTGAPITKWVRMPDTIDTSVEGLKTPYGDEGAPLDCRTFTESEWAAVYPTYDLPSEVPIDIVD